jgi:hypothetical protein
MNSESQSKQSSRSPRLHLMYFVDASETRSFSISTAVLKAAAVVLIGIAFFSLTCNAVLVFAVRHLLFVQDEIRQLKAAHVAQSVVHENLLREGPFVVANGGAELLNLTTKKVSEALIRKTPLDFEDSAASLDRRQASSAADDSASALSIQGHDPANTEASPQNPDQSPQEAADSGPSPIEISSLKHEYKVEEKKLIITFTVKNAAQFGTRISANICAIVTAVDPSGKEVHLPYPSHFDDQPDGPLHCTSGLQVHFARYKPTQLVIDTPPLAWKALNVYFSDNSGTTEHSFKLDK